MPLVLDGTNGVSGVDGTASNPAIEGTDSNTGIFYPAADTVAIGTGGTEALRVNSSAQLSLNTTVANERLNLYSNNFTYIGMYNSTTGTAGSDGGYIGMSNAELEIRNKENNIISFFTNNTERARIDAAGTINTNVGGVEGIQLTTDLNNSAISSRLLFTTSTNTIALLNASGELYFNTGTVKGSSSGTTRVVLNSNGIGLGGTSANSGTGIRFPSTQDPSSNANTLDDYEEGTYTPQIVVEGGNPLNASTVYEGSYTKIGNTVRVTVHAVWNNVTAAGGTSAIQLHNFPFPFALTSNAEGTQAYGTHFSTGIAGLNQVLNLRPVQNNVTWCYLYGFWGTTLPQNYGYLRVNSNPITNGTATTLQFVIVYRTTQ